jgi:hypothetical protein
MILDNNLKKNQYLKKNKLLDCLFAQAKPSAIAAPYLTGGLLIQLIN